MQGVPTAEIMEAVRRIEIRARRAVTEQLAGSWRSAFQARGIEFSEVREYQDGDDVSMVDWRLTARFGTPYVKQFTEERQQSVFLLVDGSGSMDFGRGAQRREYVAEIATVIALAAETQRDRVGALVFTDRTEAYVRPAVGRRHVLRIAREILGCEPSSAETDLAAGLRALSRAPLGRSLVFVLSDLFADDFTDQLAAVAQRHEVVVLDVLDPLESELSVSAPLHLIDAESGATRRITRQQISGFNASARERREELHAACTRTGADVVPLEIGGDYVGPISNLFDRRRRA